MQAAEEKMHEKMREPRNTMQFRGVEISPP